MFAALWLPRFRLQAALRWRETNGPAAVLEGDAKRGELLECNDEAMAFRVVPGLTPAQALARCPALQIVARSAAQEAAMQAMLVEIALAFSPCVEATADGVCTLDLSTAPKGACWQRLGEAMVAHGTDESLKARVGMAPHADHAWLAAVAGESSVNVVYDGAPFCAALPLSVLAPGAEFAAVMEDWGVRTIGDFLRLSATATIERLGPEAAELRRRVSGRRRRALRLVRPVESYAEAFDFDYAIETTEPLLFLLRRFVDALTGRLRASHRVAEMMTLAMPLDGAPDYTRTFSIPAPTTDADVLFRILSTHLEALVLEQQPTGVRLQIAAGNAAGRQLQLFESALRDPNRFGETLAQLKALVGEDGVGIPQPADSHRPGAFCLREFAETEGSVSTWRKKGLPLRRYRPGRSIAVRLAGERPAWLGALGPVTRSAGPYRSSGEWWDGCAWWIEEWDVELGEGALLRIARHEGGHWTVEGAYEVC